MPKLNKKLKREKRRKRVRAKVLGTVMVPRLCVTRTNTHIYTQLIDDNKGHTILSASDIELKNSKAKIQESETKTKVQKEKQPLTVKTEVAFRVGVLIAKKAQDKKIEKVVFDRGGYKYHGRVKALAEGAREGGLKF